MLQARLADAGTAGSATTNPPAVSPIVAAVAETRSHADRPPVTRRVTLAPNCRVRDNTTDSDPEKAPEVR